MFQKIAYTCYPVRDMGRAVDFYRDVLGLQPLFTGDEWSEFEIGGQRLALHKTPASSLVLEMAVVSLEARPIEQAVEKLKRRGVRLARDVQTLAYGKRASFLDSEGNLIGLYEPPPSNR